jgi:stress response protein YsnF
MLLSKTVVGLFKHRSEVDGVMASLQNTGISRDSIKVVDHDELVKHEALTAEETSSKAGIRGLLTRMFGAQGHIEADSSASPLYTDWVRNGGLLVAVNTDESNAERVSKIMETYADVDMTKRTIKTEPERKTTEASELKPARESVREAIIPRSEQGRRLKEEQTFPVIQEEMHVGKRKVERAVRVFTHVTEIPFEETVTLRDETVVVEKQSANRIASETDLKTLAESRFEVIETSEEAVVSKEAHVIEEITIGKSVVDHEEKIRGKLRKTSVDVEGLSSEKERESGFRQDFSTRFGKLGRNYSEYAPAYEFGSALASDARYLNRDWTSMEFEARRQWEARGRGSWKDFGDAVRHGWESTRSHRAA